MERLVWRRRRRFGCRFEMIASPFPLDFSRSPLMCLTIQFLIVYVVFIFNHDSCNLDHIYTAIRFSSVLIGDNANRLHKIQIRLKSFGINFFYTISVVIKFSSNSFFYVYKKNTIQGYIDDQLKHKNMNDTFWTVM